MNRAPVKRRPSLLGLTVLLLVALAGYGKAEAARSASPPGFEPEAVEVPLGDTDETITLMTTEDGGFTLDGEAFESGGLVTAENGDVYRLTLSDGAWTAVHQVAVEEVTLGASGDTVTITRDADGNYSVENGEVVTAENGNRYTLTMVDGEWKATYLPESKEIAGVSVMAMTLEDGDGYEVAGQPLDENNEGDIMVDGDRFRVSADADGNLMAEQFDATSEAVVIDRMDAERNTNAFEGTLADDEETAYNEAGTKLIVGGREHSIGELYSMGVSTQDSGSIVEAQRKKIETVLTQIKGLNEVIQAADPEETGRGEFGDLFDARWKEVDTHLDGIFGGAEADFDHLAEDSPEKPADIVTEVEGIIAALASLEVFEEALGEEGIFSSKAQSESNSDGIAEDEIADVFNNVADIWTVRLGRSENTRYGVYSKLERATAVSTDYTIRDPSTTDRGQFNGAFAYSPHKASKMADLPSGGEANYSGGTIAQGSSPDFDLYKGTIEIQVLFRSKRVHAVVSSLMDADENLFTHNSEDVEAILLPSSTMDENASWVSTTEDATIVYVVRPGTSGSSSIESTIRGQLVGEGESGGVAAIGTWSIGDTAADEAGSLRASFGAERGEDPVEQAQDASDKGLESKTSLDPDNASPVDEDGMIEVGGADPADLTKNIQVAAPDLYADGEEAVQGPNFVQSAKTAIEKHLKLLDAYIALDAADPDAADPIALAGRQTAWDKVEAEFAQVFGDQYDHDGDDQTSEVDIKILSDSGDPASAPSQLTSYPLNTAEDGPDDGAAKQEINDILAALSRLEAFEEATEDDGVFYGRDTDEDDEDGLLDGLTAEDLFDRVQYTVSVKYGHTEYTRFGAWVRTGSSTAVDAPTYDADEADHTGQFAYSPMAQTEATGFPAEGTATYEGKTIARDTAITDDQTVPQFYAGDFELQVGWGAADSADDSDVIAIVSNLMDDEGVLYDDGNGKVTMIVFQADNSVTTTGDVLGFEPRGSPSVRLRYEGFGVRDRTSSGDISGKFVGESVDGPRGVIGSWSLGSNLSGVYGADIVP